MLDGVAGERLVHAPKADILAEVLPELECYFPGVMQRIAHTHLCRWPQAIPLSPIGRSRDIAQYRAQCPAESKVILAGDYLGTPCTEGAAESGAWACAQLISRRR